MPRTELDQISAMEMARRVRSRALRSRDLVEHFIASIERWNPHLNAVVRTRYTEARREADAADARVAEGGELPPLFGVPCTIKESIALTGMPHSAGGLARRALIAEEDATAVARLRAAGAIPLGVTNISEVCMWFETTNYVYGRTNNPYDVTRTPGGSSGGEGSIIGSGASPFGLGADIGGSIRGPAFFNGIFGHKPTGRLVPGTGHYPAPPAGAVGIHTTGPMTRYAEDLMPILRVLAGPDAASTGPTPPPLGEPREVDLRAMRVVVVEDNGAIPVSDELREAQDSAARALEKRGATVKRARFPLLRWQFEIWSSMLGEAQNIPFAEVAGHGQAMNPLKELALWTVGRSRHTAPISLLAIASTLPGRLPRLRGHIVALGKRLRGELLDAMGASGVMLYPSYSSTAPPHDTPFRDMLRFHFPFAYLGIINALELPSTQVPLGLSGGGLPLGVQVVGNPFADATTIRVAMELEQAFGGWVPPKEL